MEMIGRFLFLQIQRGVEESTRWTGVIIISSHLGNRWRGIFRITCSLRPDSTMIIYMARPWRPCEKLLRR